MATPEVAPPKVPTDLQEDNRDVADLWKLALQKYKGIVGFDLEHRFANAQAMVDFGTDQMNNFHKFRHDGKKVDKLRSIFKSNLDLLEKGAEQLISAATPAFPPAAAIGTAITYVLQACRAQSADYDVVMVFFDDMNSFLQRIVILETRLPSHRSYQNCLMDVFDAFLSMCGFAHKYIVLGRFKKWITNLLEGQDSDLAGARKTMDLKLSRLQNATEFAILGNTEETKKMSRELRANSEAHSRMLEEQRQVLGSIQETAENTYSDVQKILKLISNQGMDKSKALASQANDKPPAANRVRSALMTVDGDSHEYTVLKETMIPNMCTWLFTEPSWGSWVKQPKEGQRPILVITGPPGVGKSHLAFAMHGKLRELVDDDAERKTALAHFYFREQQSNFKYFLCGIITIINQIAEQNAHLCESINAELARDEIMIDRGSWQDLVRHILSPVFAAESKNHLLLLLDGLDELYDSWSFIEFVEIVRESKLRISIVITCRDNFMSSLGLDEEPQPMTIEVTKEKQLIDLKTLAWHRIKQLRNLATFSPYIQTRVADQIVEVSPNLLYAEHMLARLDTLGRESAVLQAVNKPMPASIHDLYDILLDECQRRMSATHQHVASMLLHWMAFARREMTLDEVTSLLRYLANDDKFTLEEIPEFMSKFIRVGDQVDLEARRSTPRTKVDVEGAGEEEEEYLKADGQLPVKFVERSMVDFFRELGDEDKPFRWRESEAQRRMFLASVDIAEPAPEGTTSRFHPELQNYAADELLSHWVAIECETHTAAQQIEVMEALAKAMSNKTGLAEALSRLPELFYTGTEDATETVDEKIKTWVGLLEKDEIGSELSEDAARWWRELADDPRRLRLGLAKGFLELLYRAPDGVTAQKQFHLTKNVLHVCQLQNLLAENGQRNYPEKAVMLEEGFDVGTMALGIINLFDDIPMDDRAYRAASEVIADYHADVAVDLCLKALELNKESGTITERCKTWLWLTFVQIGCEELDKAREAVESCLEYLQNETVPVAIKQEVWITKAHVETIVGNLEAAAASYREARAVEPGTMVAGDVLVKEMAVYRRNQDMRGYMDTLKSYTPLERLTWLTMNYTSEGEFRQSYVRDCATALGEKDFVVAVFHEAIGYLDNINAGAPLKIDLARVHLQVAGDLEAARKVLDEVFDTSSNGWGWAMTNEDPQVTLLRAIDTMTDTIFGQFYRSRDPKFKVEAFDALKGLLQRTFTYAIPVYSPLVLLHYHVTLATMSLKLSHATEFHSLLQSVVDACLVALGDGVGWNDGKNMLELGRAVAVLAKAVRNPRVSAELTRYARTVVSAMFSRLDPRLDDELTQRLADAQAQVFSSSAEYDGDRQREQPEDEGDLVNPIVGLFTCDGACRPVSEFSWWGERTAYCCLTCSTTLLCEPCYANRRGGEEEEEARGLSDPPRSRYYCGLNHDFLKLPIEGWQGVKDGRFMIEAEEPVAVDDFFAGLRAKVQEAWDEFWVGA